LAGGKSEEEISLGQVSKICISKKKGGFGIKKYENDEH
jgi:hypothetical protein